MINTIYEAITADPWNLIKDMTYDDYMDWLDLGTKEDLEATLEVFENSNVPNCIIDILKIELTKK
ncbi:MAG: hypothetical protein KGY51_11685 [Psychroflexus sp.]|nr:hypothetical protein [Psychroflexus sp.]